MWALNSTASQDGSATLEQSIAKLHVTSDIARLTAQPMFVANPEAGKSFFDVPALAGAKLSIFHDNSC
jgi:hypothetical protein